MTGTFTRPPRPSVKIQALEAEPIAWLHCSPLPPIPLGLAREVTVGRHEKCDLVLPHKEVSRHHASVKATGRQLVLEDQGSSNGTYLNGKRVTTQPLKVGDALTIGPYEIEIHATREAGTDTSNRLDKTRQSFTAAELGAAFAGRIEELSLVEVLQQIDFNRKSGTLAITSNHQRGQIAVADGRPLHASFGDQRDEAATRAMIRLREGRFVFSGEVAAGEPTMRATITAILLDATREADEAAAHAAPPHDPMAETDTGHPRSPGTSTAPPGPAPFPPAASRPADRGEPGGRSPP